MAIPSIFSQILSKPIDFVCAKSYEIKNRNLLVVKGSGDIPREPAEV
jgi:hypothetical protein